MPFNSFGGEKNSDIGRFNRRWIIDAYTTAQWVTIQHKPRSSPVNTNQIDGPRTGG